MGIPRAMARLCSSSVLSVLATVPVARRVSRARREGREVPGRSRRGEEEGGREERRERRKGEKRRRRSLLRLTLWSSLVTTVMVFLPAVMLANASLSIVW